jgi:glucose 1-dehydrogenase
VNIGSVSSHRPQPNNAAFVAAKHGVIGLTKVASLENAPHGIRVNTVCPGSFDTPVLDRAFGDRKEEAMKPYLSTLPLKRLGRPEELAHAVLFLMTNGYTTGTVLHVNGGALLI